MALLQRLWRFYSAHQHLLLILLCLFLVLGSSSLMMIRSIRAGAGFWDLSHVYLGLLCVPLSLTFLVSNCTSGRWRQYFSLFIGDWRQIGADIGGLFKGKLPVAGGKGLFSLIEGLGMLLLLGVALTGLLWYLTQGSSDALLWRGWHKHLAHGFIGFLIVHAICALSHLLDFFRQ